MGGTPLFALNIVGFPEDDLPINILSEIMRGGLSIAEEAGMPILGGHTVKDKELKYGMAVTGEVEKSNLTRNNTALPGDVLLLTKPLGTGIISTAIKRNKAPTKMIDDITSIMITLNKSGAEAMEAVGVNACTDVTGYGLLGHLLEMCKGSGVSAEIEFSSLPFIEGVFELAMDGIIPGGTKRNLKFVNPDVDFSDDITEIQQFMAADAQTSGGLLIAVAAEKTNDLVTELQKRNTAAVKIGKMTEQKEKQIYIQ